MGTDFAEVSMESGALGVAISMSSRNWQDHKAEDVERYRATNLCGH